MWTKFTAVIIITIVVVLQSIYPTPFVNVVNGDCSYVKILVQVMLIYMKTVFVKLWRIANQTNYINCSNKWAALPPTFPLGILHICVSILILLEIF